MQNNGSVLIKGSIYAETLVGIWGACSEVLIEVTIEIALECWHYLATSLSGSLID